MKSTISLTKVKLNLVFCLFFTVFTVFAQEPLAFVTSNHDFGNISEVSGPVDYAFVFVNESDAPVQVLNVKASCGCTTPGWTREVVQPGDSGFIKARYNPTNRPGRFRKSLKVSTNPSTYNTTLYINGFVEPRPKTAEEAFPHSFGIFRLDKQALNMGNFTNEAIVEKSFNIYNASDTTSSLRDLEEISLPEHISIKLTAEFLNPREVGKLLVRYDPKKKADLGFVSDEILVDDLDKISVFAVIDKYIPPMTAEELDKAPQIAFSKYVHEFEKVEAGAIVEAVFEITNTGQEKLTIDALKANCSCLELDMSKKSIKKNQSAILKVLFDTSGMRANQYKSVSIYSNDPINPTRLVTIKGPVESQD